MIKDDWGRGGKWRDFDWIRIVKNNQRESSRILLGNLHYLYWLYTDAWLITSQSNVYYVSMWLNELSMIHEILLHLFFFILILFISWSSLYFPLLTLSIFIIISGRKGWSSKICYQLWWQLCHFWLTPTFLHHFFICNLINSQLYLTRLVVLFIRL